MHALMSNQNRTASLVNKRISIVILLLVGSLGVGPVGIDLKIREPFVPLGGGNFAGSNVMDSPDPLVGYRWKDPKGTDDLQVFTLRPQIVATDTPRSFGDVDSLCTNKPLVSVSGPGSIRADFGVESAAWLEFDSPDLGDSGSAVEMSISEYNQPGVVNPGAAHAVKTLVPIRHGTTYRLELNRLLFEGVRFGWIHVRQYIKPWHITAMRLVCQAKPVNYVGSFSCSDPRLTRIWYTGAYGIRVNFSSEYICSVLMDRGDRYSFTGDAHTIQAGALVAFGDYDFIRHNIERTAKDFNGIKTYALYWVLSVVDYYRYTGDSDLLNKYADAAVKRCTNGDRFYSQATNLVYVGSDERLGGCFEQVNIEESRNTYRMLLLRTCLELADVLTAAGHNEQAAVCRSIADRRIAELRQDPKWFEKMQLFSASEAAASFANPGELAHLADQEYTDRVGRVAMSPFNQYFVLLGMARAGKKEQALTTVRDLWGGMIDYGATTFAEAFRPSWNRFLKPNDPIPNGTTGWTSLGHAWGGGVCKWLTEEVGGIAPASPGFKTYRVRPFPGATLTTINTTVPTPAGLISASFDLTKGAAELIAPPNTIGQLCVPKASREIKSIRVNGELAWDGVFHPVQGIGAATEEPDSICFTSVQPGHYTLKIEYNGAVPPVVEEPLHYPATVLIPDDHIQGNWRDRIGKQGYVFFGAADSPQKLPAFVTSVKPFGDGMHAVQWTTQSDDLSTLLLPTGFNFRTLGCLASGTPHPSRMSFRLDITLASPVPYQVSLYFVDRPSSGRQQAIEMFDLKTLKLIAPVQNVKDFARG
jgi:alpha-L-rhamnosidase